MLTNIIKVMVSGQEIEINSGTTLLEISKMFANKGKRQAIVAKVDGHYRELFEEAKNGNQIEFLDLTDCGANRIYLNGLILLVNYAFYQIFGNKNIVTVKHSADKALCFETSQKISKEKLKEVEKKMRAVVEANLPITKMTVLKSEAIEYFHKMHDEKKAKLLEYMTNTYVHLYKD